MKYSFENLNYEFGFAHGGVSPIYFCRTEELSSNFAFNFLDFVIVPISSSIGKHTHATDNQEIYVIISGCGEMIVDGIYYQVKDGDVIVNAIGGTHELINTGDQEIHLVVIETPLKVTNDLNSSNS